MSYPTESDVEKLGPAIRGFACFLLLCALLAAAGLLFALVTEPFDYRILLGAAVTGIMVHVCGCVVFRGYAPKYLLFAHGPNKNT
jgi:hypothetical protein